MAIFQKPFGQKKGEDMQVARDVVADDSVANKDVGESGIQWITERHVACVFLLDTSSSMSDNDAIGKLSKGLETFKKQTLNDSSFDEHTKACIDVAIVSFGPDVKVWQNFTSVSDMALPTLTANGGTPMGAALEKGLDMVTEQKAKYNNFATPYFRPWIFCITDGEPNDSYLSAVERLKEMEAKKGVLGYCVGVENFNRKKMASIFDPERIFVLENLNFPALFKFVSNSLSTVRNSDPTAGNTVAVDAPKDLHQLNLTF